MGYGHWLKHLANWSEKVVRRPAERPEHYPHQRDKGPESVAPLSPPPVLTVCWKIDR